MSEVFRTALEQQREKMSSAQRKSSFSKQFLWQYPLQFENGLNKIFNKIFQGWVSSVDKFVENHPETKKRKDSFQSDIDKYLTDQDALIVAYVAAAITEVESLSYFDTVLEFVKKYNLKQLDRFFSVYLGKTLPYTTEWWSAIKAQLRTTIESSATASIRSSSLKIREFVLQATRANFSHDRIIEGIQTINSQLTEGRASFLARDIAGTYNSLVAKQIDTQILGTDFYKWNTRADEKVRGDPNGLYPKHIPSHFDMEQKLCRWSDPSVYSNDGAKTWIPRKDKMPKKAPGEEPGCRCGATPWILGLLADIDARLEKNHAITGT